MVWPHNPVQIAHSILHNMSQINFDQQIYGEPLTRFLDKRDLKLSKHLTFRAIAAKQVFGSNAICVLRQIVLDIANNGATRLVLEGQERSLKSNRKAILGRVVDEDRLEDRLGNVDMIARTRSIVIALRLLTLRSSNLPLSTHSSFWIIAP